MRQIFRGLSGIAYTANKPNSRKSMAAEFEIVSLGSAEMLSGDS